MLAVPLLAGDLVGGSRWSVQAQVTGIPQGSIVSVVREPEEPISFAAVFMGP